MLEGARYISLTTFRRDGTPVATPVWVAPLGDRFVVITQSASHKARRLRRDPRVEVRPCDLRGRVAPGAPRHRGTATFLADDERAAALGAIRRKYGVAARLWPVLGRVMNLIRRRPQRPGAVIALELHE